MPRLLLSLLLLLGALALPACGGRGEETRVRLATTTSTDNSGLLRAILPAFEAKHGVRVDVIAVGTGQALALGERGGADILLVHAREREDAFVASGHGIDRRDIMWNDFVIAGPKEDPARIRGLESAASALRLLAETKATFVSRGDDSGTHTRERALWKEAGGRPAWDDYLSAGQGMGPCLTIADQKRAYVLADRGTFIAYRGRMDLEVLVEGDQALRNPYGAILVNPARHPDGEATAARLLLEYLSSKEGQAAIAAFRIDGEQLFHPHGGP